MPKRPDNNETVLLALELLKRIPRNRKISAPELHAQLTDTPLARDLRTIQRQLEKLSEHFDLERDDRSKRYGYRWKKQARGFSLPTLTAQESLLLSLAEQHLHNLLPASLMKSMAGFFNQARSNLTGLDIHNRLEREWRNKVRVVSTSQPLIPPKIMPEVFDAVTSALYANQWLEVDYRNAAGKLGKADVMPLGLAQQGPRVYLVCRYRGFENERSLALHRIVSAKVSPFTFERPKNFDLQKYDDDGRFGFGDGQRIRLTFRITKDAGYHLLESALSNDQQVKVLENHYEISATVVDSAQLKWWLTGFGNNVTNVCRANSTSL